MRTKRLILVCPALVLLSIVGTLPALAWGPHASRAICLCAFQVLESDAKRIFEGREQDLVVGATIPDPVMSRYAVQSAEVEPFRSIILQIPLLREAREREVTDYLAYRFGVLAKMTANTIQPFGIPENEEERRLKERFDADIEEHIEDLAPGSAYRREKQEFIYYPVSYFRELRRFLSDAEYFIGVEYARDNAYGEYTGRAATKYFEDAVNAVADVWYTVLTERKYFGEVPPSSLDLTQYYAEQVDYFLRKSQPEKAREAYQAFAETNPGLAEPYEVLGDSYYRAGDYEQAMEEYRRGLSMRGSWPEVEEKIVKHYTKTGEQLLASNTGAAFQKALQSFEKALEVSPGNPVAVSGRERAKTQLAALEARRARDDQMLTGANKLFEGASQAESARDFAKAIDLYEKAAAVYTLVSSEFQEADLAARAGSEDAARQIRSILSTAISQAKELINQGSQFEDQGAFDQAISAYERVPGAVSMITQKYKEQYDEAQRIVKNAATRKEAAKTQLETQQTQGQPGG